MSSLRTKFYTDKQTVLQNVENFLQNTKDPQIFTSEDIEVQRSRISKLVNSGKFTEALRFLENIRDLKSGISQHFIHNENGTLTLIRDARNANVPMVLETESFEMQYLNAIRAGMDLAGNNNDLKAALQNKANDFFSETGFHNKSNLSQKTLAKKELKNAITDIGNTLGEYGIEQAFTKLNVAKDFQNFNDRHANIVTVSNIQHGETNHTVIEAEVAFKNLTNNQKDDYRSISDENSTPKPLWYQAMPDWEKNLCKKYAPIIIQGEHVIPTQLKQIIGVKNAFEKITAAYDPINSKLEILNESLHAGTLASFAYNKDQRQIIADENSRQIQELLEPEVKLHANTLNSGPIGIGNDPEIVRQTIQSMKNVRGNATNTPFNIFRIFGVSSNFSGAKNTLDQIAKSFDNDKDFREIQQQLQPKNLFGRLIRKNNSKEVIDQLFNKGKISPQIADMLSDAVELRYKIEQADKFFRFNDRENLSLQISNRLNFLTQKISNLPNDSLKSVLPQEKVLTMCASGKDRTGLAEHDQTAQSIATKFGIPIKEIDQKLLAGGHTAQQAGGVYSGGGSVGNLGTKSENRAGLPRSRKQDLEYIIQDSASTNKIKGNSKQNDAEIAKIKLKKPFVDLSSISKKTAQPTSSIRLNRKKLSADLTSNSELIEEARKITESLRKPHEQSEKSYNSTVKRPLLEKSNSI